MRPNPSGTPYVTDIQTKMSSQCWQTKPRPSASIKRSLVVSCILLLSRHTTKSKKKTVIARRKRPVKYPSLTCIDRVTVFTEYTVKASLLDILEFWRSDCLKETRLTFGTWLWHLAWAEYQIDAKDQTWTHSVVWVTLHTKSIHQH